MLAAALLAGAAAAPAHATEGDARQGEASATVLSAQLDVGLLDKAVDVPLAATLNEVSTADGGGTERKTALTARLDGVENGKPFSVLQARVADAEAGRNAEKAWGEVTLVDAKVHVPGLPLLSVVEVEKVTSHVECVAGEKPQAEANVLGSVKVLGKHVKLTAGGPTQVTVPGVGEVRLELSATDTTSNTAAASALDLTIAVDPLELGVAEVSGEVTLAEATCTAPEAGDTGAQTVPEEKETVDDEQPAAEQEPDDTELAATGGSSVTPYLAGGAVLLLAAGGAAVFAVRRRGASRG
jgi:LPXTG-motif cell wall-anchored protein